MADVIHPPRSARSLGGLGRVFWAAALIVAAFAAWSWSRDLELRGLNELPPATREGLYRRTMANLTTVCAGAEAQRIDSFCREEAAVVLRLPECDAACTRIARAHLVVPTR